MSLIQALVAAAERAFADARTMREAHLLEARDAERFVPLARLVALADVRKLLEGAERGGLGAISPDERAMVLGLLLGEHSKALEVDLEGLRVRRRDPACLRGGMLGRGTGSRDDKLTLAVGNLHSDVSEDVLYELFAQVAPVARVYIPDGDPPRATGFVELHSFADVEYAARLLDGTALFGWRIRVVPVHRKGHSSSPAGAGGAQVLLFPAPATASREDVWDFAVLLGCGSVADVVLPASRSGRPLGHAYVHLTEEEEAELLVVRCSGQRLLGVEPNAAVVRAGGQAVRCRLYDEAMEWARKVAEAESGPPPTQPPSAPRPSVPAFAAAAQWPGVPLPPPPPMAQPGPRPWPRWAQTVPPASASAVYR